VPCRIPKGCGDFGSRSRSGHHRAPLPAGGRTAIRDANNLTKQHYRTLFEGPWAGPSGAKGISTPMSTWDDTEIAANIRSVTDEEADFYSTHGWVNLTGLLSPRLAEHLLARLKMVTGVEYDELSSDDMRVRELSRTLSDEGLARFASPRATDNDVFRVAASRRLGDAAAHLTGIQSLRLFTDSILCKMPHWIGQDNRNHGLDGIYYGSTPWHLDAPILPIDRKGSIQFWIALCDITPEMGSMQYLSGSHREGSLGCFQKGPEQDLFEMYPQLKNYEASPAPTLGPGDVLCHDSFTLHSAQENRTNRIRWAYTSYRIPGNALFNGQSFGRTDSLNLTQWQPFEHPDFPIVT
jgi:hypothetical protein